MRFLFPGFLFALLAVAIPIIIHLFNFRRFKKVYFSNVRFLKSIDEQTSSRKNLKNKLILISRILAVIFLVLAFARPYKTNTDQTVFQNSRAVSIYIDNSYSMEGINKEGTLFDEARRRAKEIASTYSLNDKFQILTNDFEGKHQRFYNYDDFANAVDEIKISPAVKNLNQILSRQKDLFLNETNSSKTSYLISDFQKNLVSTELFQADSAVDIRLIRVRSNTIPNISIDSVWITSAIIKPGEAGKIVARFRNNSDADATNIPVKLIINEQQRAIGNVNIKARGIENDTLSFSGLSAGWKSAEISITDYPMIFDDRFYFSFNVKSELKILAINGDQVNPYLRALYHSDKYFNFQNTSAGNINYSGLNQQSVLILNEVGDFSSGFIQQLKLYVEKGGNLVILPSLELDLLGLKELLINLKTDIPLKVITAETKVSGVNLQHPLFKGVFETTPKNMNLPLVKKYLQYSSLSKTNKQSLLSLPGYETFLSEYRLGKGKIYLLAVPLNDQSGNFPRHSIFVPVMYQISMLSSQDQLLYSTIGTDQTVEIPRITLDKNQLLTLKKNNFETIPDLRQTPSGTQVYVADQIKEPGNYKLFKSDSLIANLSFNQTGKESDLSYATDEELLARLPKNKASMINSDSVAIQKSIKSPNLGIELWKLCIILALLGLAAEIFLIHIFQTKVAKN
ncbi:MAG: BatA domain-containing protein [Flavobacterium sp.]|nr:BatA domain-containing protein [Pedobacter sp.]